ncbi:MAG TPA: EAL domain-containing protein [Burkholderiales bacterium]|nr:EAL domain-containing protein [Burkholderiales bacterium]
MAWQAERKGTAESLIAALEQDRFVLYGQRIAPVAAKDDKRLYQEILVRFLDEEEKLLPPGTFLPILEGYKLMTVLDTWVVRRVMRWVRERAAARGGGLAPRCSINLAAETIENENFAKAVAGQIANGGVPAEALSFEVTEAEAAAHRAALALLVARLRPLGCTFALTGYTGAAIGPDELRSLGMSYVKIEGAIVRNLERNREDYARAGRLVELCRSVGLRTIGEMVEREEVLRKLAELGVDYAQGYAIARPAPI